MNKKINFNLERIENTTEMLVISNFSFSNHNIFNGLFLQGCYKSVLCGKDITQSFLMSFSNHRFDRCIANSDNIAMSR